jgi:FkbM family methyltransferase
LPGHILRYGDIELQTRPREDFVFYGTYIAGQYDALELQEGDIVLDAGANIGDYAIQASRRVGSSGIVLAVEPDPDLIPYIEHNLTRNGCHNVKVIQCALGTPGQARLERKSDGGTVANQVSRDGSGPLVTVRSIAEVLDGAGVETLSVLKLDIEGAEFEVLSGYTGLSGVRLVAVELHGHENQIGVPQLLAPYFDTWSLDTGRLWRSSARRIAEHPIDFTLAELRSDFVALKGVARWLRGKGSPVPSLNSEECSLVYGINRRNST